VLHILDLLDVVDAGVLLVLPRSSPELFKYEVQLTMWAMKVFEIT
jgi:hypothetical protein